MKKLDPVVKTETLRILCGTLLVQAVTQLVFTLLRRWDVTVLAGGLLGGAWAVLNFLLMGITVQNAVGLPENEARSRIKGSYSLRTLCTVGVVALAILAPCFHWVPAVVGIFSPRLTIAVLSIFRKEYGAPVENPRPVPDEDEDEEGDELERLLDKVYGGKVDYGQTGQTTSQTEPPAPVAENKPAPQAGRKE